MRISEHHGPQLISPFLLQNDWGFLLFKPNHGSPSILIMADITPGLLKRLWRNPDFQRVLRYAVVALISGAAGIEGAYLWVGHHVVAMADEKLAPYEKLVAGVIDFQDSRATEAFETFVELLNSPHFDELQKTAQEALCDDLLYIIVNSEHVQDHSSEYTRIVSLIPNKLKSTPWRRFQIAQYKMQTGELDEAFTSFARLREDFDDISDSTTAELCLRYQLFIALSKSDSEKAAGIAKTVAERPNSSYDYAAIRKTIEHWNDTKLTRCLERRYRGSLDTAKARFLTLIPKE